MSAISNRIRLSKRHRAALEAALGSIGAQEKAAAIRDIERAVCRYERKARDSKGLAIHRLDEVHVIAEAAISLGRGLKSDLDLDTFGVLIKELGKRLKQSKGKKGDALKVGASAMQNLWSVLMHFGPASLHAVDEASIQVWRSPLPADAALRQLAVDVVTICKDASRKELVFLPPTGVRATRMTGVHPHPLGVVFSAIGIAVGPRATDLLQRFAEGGKLKPQLFMR